MHLGDVAAEISRRAACSGGTPTAGVPSSAAPRCSRPTPLAPDSFTHSESPRR